MSSSPAQNSGAYPYSDLLSLTSCPAEPGMLPLRCATEATPLPYFCRRGCSPNARTRGPHRLLSFLGFLIALSQVTLTLAFLGLPSLSCHGDPHTPCDFLLRDFHSKLLSEFSLLGCLVALFPRLLSSLHPTTSSSSSDLAGVVPLLSSRGLRPVLTYQ